MHGSWSYVNVLPRLNGVSLQSNMSPNMMQNRKESVTIKGKAWNYFRLPVVVYDTETWALKAHMGL